MIVAGKFYGCSSQAFTMHNTKSLLEGDLHGHSGGIAVLEKCRGPMWIISLVAVKCQKFLLLFAESGFCCFLWLKHEEAACVRHALLDLRDCYSEEEVFKGQ